MDGRRSFPGSGRKFPREDGTRDCGHRDRDMGSKVTGEEERCSEWECQAAHSRLASLRSLQGRTSAAGPRLCNSFREAGVPWARVPGEAAFASVSVQMAGERSSRPPAPPHPLLSPGPAAQGSVIFRSSTICSRCRADSVCLHSGRDSHAASGEGLQSQPALCGSQREATGTRGAGFWGLGSGASRAMALGPGQSAWRTG